MKTPLRMVPAALVLLLGPTLRGADAPQGDKPQGHVLILDNDHTLEGDIDRIGDQFRIRRASAETWVPAKEGCRLCANIADAYQVLRARSNTDDIDEHLKLAQWCCQRHLRQEAVGEVKQALAIQPENSEARRLLNVLQTATRPQPPPAAPAPKPEPAHTLPQVDVAPETFNAFATHIQPILMNACMHCHTPEHTGTFQLQRVSMEGTAARATQHNLAMALAHVNLHAPEASPLLMKACLPHGDRDTPPLSHKGPQSAALFALQDWVKETVANNPLLAQELAGTSVTHFAPEVPEPPPAAKSARTGEPAVNARPTQEQHSHPPQPPPNAVATPQTNPVTTMPPTPAPAAPVNVSDAKTAAAPAPAEPVDEFDPVLFNRQFHPSGKQP